MHTVTLPVNERNLPDGIILRDLAGPDEYADAVRIQEETWGQGFTERMPATIFLITQKVGGVAAGAFLPNGRLVGLVFGLTGVRDGHLVHWSDLLAVRPEAQGRRLGEALKRYQRDRCRAIGVESMYWSFDPFVARNAHLNLNVLGAAVDEFVPDMYGTATNSPVHGNLGTDRLVVKWAVSADPAPVPSARELIAGVPCAGGAPGTAPEDGQPLPGGTAVTVRVPSDYQALLANDVARAREWRKSVRRAFIHYLGSGWHVAAFVPPFGDDATYLLTRAS